MSTYLADSSNARNYYQAVITQSQKLIDLYKWIIQIK